MPDVDGYPGVETDLIVVEETATGDYFCIKANGNNNMGVRSASGTTTSYTDDGGCICIAGGAGTDVMDKLECQTVNTGGGATDWFCTAGPGAVEVAYNAASCP